MPDKPFHSLIRSLRRLVGAGDGCGSDRQLLQRYFSARDEEAFAIVVERHARMVWGVCRRMLGNEHEAEDAFQATFMALAIKGATLPEESVGGWLHEVAWRAVSELKVRQRKHDRKHDLGKADMRTISPISEEERKELYAVMDEEIEQLPSKYRKPLVLCYLEGKTYEEAARELGWPAGTVSSRLAKARDLLRGRLVRRGLALSAAAFGVSLSQAAVAAAVPPTLMQATIKSASLAAAGVTAGTVSAKVASLAGNVVHSMFMTKVKTALVLLLCTGALAAGAAFVSHQTLIGAAKDPVSQSAPAETQKPQPSPVAETEPVPETKPAAATEPVALPLKARLVAKQDAYAFDPKVFKLIDILKTSDDDIFYGAPVDLELELCNTGTEPIRIRLPVGELKNERGEKINAREWQDFAWQEGLEMDFQGPGVWCKSFQRKFSKNLQPPRREIELNPGQTHREPIRYLRNAVFHDHRKYSIWTAYWTEPGEYTLAIRYHLEVSPPPPGASDAGGGFGRIVVAADPIKLVVRKP